MKKFVSMVCVLALLVCCVSFSAEASDNVTALKNTTRNNSALEAMGYYPFIYSEDDGFAWAREIIGDCSMCEPGYLYVQDLITKEVWQVLDCPVDIFRVIERTIYCIVDGNKILRTDYWDAPPVTIYTAESGNLGNLEIHDNQLYYTESDSVMRLDLETGVAEPIVTCSGIINLYPVDDNSFAWVSSDGSEHLYRMDSATDEPICFDTLLASQAIPVDVSTGPVASPQNTRVVDLPLYPSTQEIFPLSDYPHGSYFTQNGSACTTHAGCTASSPGNCKVYRSSIQCMGFAKYAYDRYSHRSESSLWPSSGDPHFQSGNSIATDQDVQLLFSSIPYGSYLRLDRWNDGDLKGNHSIITAGVSSTTVTIYDANNAGYPNLCMVQLYSVTFESFRQAYEYVNECIAHNFVNVFRNNSNTHAIRCSYSNCGGYILESHYSANPGANAICDACGYVGPIMEDFNIYKGNVIGEES